MAAINDLDAVADDPSPVGVGGAGVPPPTALVLHTLESKASTGAEPTPEPAREEPSTPSALTPSAVPAPTAPIDRPSDASDQIGPATPYDKTSGGNDPARSAIASANPPVAEAPPAPPAGSAKPVTTGFYAEQRDLEILAALDSEGRRRGFRIRKGGNPTMFLRYALRRLEAQLAASPDLWEELRVFEESRKGHHR